MIYQRDCKGTLYKVEHLILLRLLFGAELWYFSNKNKTLIQRQWTHVILVSVYENKSILMKLHLKVYALSKTQYYLQLKFPGWWQYKQKILFQMNLKLSHKSLKRSFNLYIEILFKQIFHAQIATFATVFYINIIYNGNIK